MIVSMPGSRNLCVCVWGGGDLLTRLMDFDQTPIYTLLGGGKSLLDFGDFDLIFKVTEAP